MPKTNGGGKRSRPSVPANEKVRWSYNTAILMCQDIPIFELFFKQKFNHKCPVIRIGILCNGNQFFHFATKNAVNNYFVVK